MTRFKKGLKKARSDNIQKNIKCRLSDDRDETVKHNKQNCYKKIQESACLGGKGDL